MSRAGWWAAAFTACLVSAAAEEPPSLTDVRAAAEAGRHEDVVADAGRALDALAADPASAGWSIEFGQVPVEDARVGARYIYYQTSSSSRVPVASPITLAHDPRRDPPDARQYDSLPTMTCVDGSTGRKVWTRRFIPHTKMAVDPRDDALWTWHHLAGRPILRIDPATGDDVVRGKVPESRGGTDAPHSLRADGLQLWGLNGHGSEDRAAGLELDPAEGSIFQAFPPSQLSPNRLRVLQVHNDRPAKSIRLVPAVPGLVCPPDWSFAVMGDAGPPSWMGGDVLVLAGPSLSSGVATRLDGKTGRPLWSHDLAEPAAVAGASQLRNGWYAPGGWSTIGRLEGKVAALGLRGTIFLLDPETGDEVGRLATASPPLAFPRVIGGRLVAAGQAGVRAVPFADVPGLGSGDDAKRELNALRVRSLLALKRAAEAEQAALAMIREYPASSQAWSLVADAREAAGADPVAARVAAMAASGAEDDARLLASHGLLKRFPTARVAAPPVAAGPLVLVAGLDGRLITVDPGVPRIVEVEQGAGSPYSLSYDGQYLGIPNRPKRPDGRLLCPPPVDLQPFDPLLRPIDPRSLPKGWYDNRGVSQASLVVDGVMILPLKGGGVRTLRDGKLVDLPPLEETPEMWRIARVGRDVLGYGEAGVYRLDADFRPAERVVPAPVVGQDRGMVYALTGDDEAICMLVASASGERLQVRSRDGFRLVRDEPVRMGWNTLDQPYLLRPLGDGYLLSGQELLWLPKHERGRPWRFDVLLDEKLNPSRSRDDLEAATFGLARAVGDRLIVAAHGGGIYVFSMPAVTGRSKPPG